MDPFPDMTLAPLTLQHEQPQQISCGGHCSLPCNAGLQRNHCLHRLLVSSFVSSPRLPFLLLQWLGCQSAPHFRSTLCGLPRRIPGSLAASKDRTP